MALSTYVEDYWQLVFKHEKTAYYYDNLSVIFFLVRRPRKRQHPSKSAIANDISIRKR